MGGWYLGRCSGFGLFPGSDRTPNLQALFQNIHVHAFSGEGCSRRALVYITSPSLYYFLPENEGKQLKENKNK